MRALICTFLFLVSTTTAYGNSGKDGHGPNFDLGKNDRDRIHVLVTFTSTYLVTQVFQKSFGWNKWKSALAGALISGTTFMALDKLDKGANYERDKMSGLGVGIGISVSLTLLGL